MSEREKAITLSIDYIETLLALAAPHATSLADKGVFKAVQREVEQVRAMGLPGEG